MRRFSKLLVVLGTAAALILPISTAAAATTAVSYNMAGVEYAATFANSSLAGAAASGSKTELGLWNAVVMHDFGDINTGVDAITGGTFAFKSRLHTFTGTITAGTFGPTVGTCAKRTIAVHAVVGDQGSFDLTLTRYGYVSNGACVVSFATARGTATLAFPA